MIICVIGKIASGKGKAADFFVEKYGFRQITMSNFLREIAEQKNLKCDRNHLSAIQLELRKKFGEEILAEMVITKIAENSWENVVIDGCRTPLDVSILKKKLKAKVIFVDADEKIRFERQKSRRRQGFLKSFDLFLQKDSFENAMFDFYLTKSYADFEVKNDKSLKDLYKELEKIAKKINMNNTTITIKIKKKIKI